MDVKTSYDERVTVCLESDLLIRLLPVHCYVVNRKAQTTFIGGTYNKQTFDIKFISFAWAAGRCVCHFVGALSCWCFASWETFSDAVPRMEFAVLRAIFVICAFLQLVGARPGGMSGMGGSSKRIYIYIYVCVSDSAFVLVFYPALLSSRKYFPVTNDQIERTNWRHFLEIISQKLVVIRQYAAFNLGMKFLHIFASVPYYDSFHSATELPKQQNALCFRNPKSFYRG